MPIQSHRYISYIYIIHSLSLTSRALIQSDHSSYHVIAGWGVLMQSASVALVPLCNPNVHNSVLWLVQKDPLQSQSSRMQIQTLGGDTRTKKPDKTGSKSSKTQLKTHDDKTAQLDRHSYIAIKERCQLKTQILSAQYRRLKLSALSLLKRTVKPSTFRTSRRTCQTLSRQDDSTLDLHNHTTA